MNQDGVSEMSMGLAFMIMFWMILFYGLAATVNMWREVVPPSTKKHENETYWMVRDINGSLISVVVATLAVPAMLAFWGEPDEVRFARAEHLILCKSDRYGGHLEFWGMAIAFAGMSLTAYLIFDLIVLFIHGFATPDYVAHHVCFIVAGLIIRGNCVLPYSAAILMSMEASTPFLNYILFFRHRGDVYTTKCMMAGACFFLLFVIIRLILNTYGAVELIRKRELLIAQVPVWQAWSLIVMVVIGAAVQYFWFPQILRVFAANFRPSAKESIQHSVIPGCDECDHHIVSSEGPPLTHHPEHSGDES